MKHKFPITLPNLSEVQRISFCWFLTDGLPQEMTNYSSIINLKTGIQITIYGQEYKIKYPNFTIFQALKKKGNYNLKVYVLMSLKIYDPERQYSTLIYECPEKEQVFLGEIPLMTNKGTFIFNGCERVIINQLVRSPGVYFRQINKLKKNLYDATIITNYGSWLTFELEQIESHNFIWIKIDKEYKIPINWFLIGFGLEENEISETLKNYHFLLKSMKSVILLIYDKMSETSNIAGLNNYLLLIILKVKELIQAKLLDRHYYDLGEVGRVKINKKLGINLPLSIRILTSLDILKILDYLIDIRLQVKQLDDIDNLENRRVRSVGELLQIQVRIALNRLKKKISTDEKFKNQTFKGKKSIKKSNTKLLEENDLIQNRGLFEDNDLFDDSDDNLFNDDDLLENNNLLEKKTICIDDITFDIMDPVKNLESNKSEISLIPENFNNDSNFQPSYFINPKILTAVMREFFGLSPLSQYFDETNALAQLTHKRRISSLGPGGLNSEHVSFAARDIHPTQYGRLCPIETPEGQKAGLISSLAIYATINKHGFIQTPFFRVFKGKVFKSLPPIYLTAENEKFYKIANADVSLDNDTYLSNNLIPVRYQEEFINVSKFEVDLIAISPIQIISTGAALIPFLEHDDANRALMGSNMQRQAVPLLYPQKPIIGTGIEFQIANDSQVVVINLSEGIVDSVSADRIIIFNNNTNKTDSKIYFLDKYRRSNQETGINHRPNVWPGEFVKLGQILADGPGTDGGELALGQNLNVAYMPWEGYNYEDAILVSEKLIHQDLLTSIHIEKYEIEIKETNVGMEEMTREIPNVSEYSIRHLDADGLIYKGAFVESGDILVGKITPKAESDEIPESRLLKAVFNIKVSDVNDTSLRVPNGISGRVIDIQIFSQQQGDELNQDVYESICIFIAELKKIKVGDKIAGRHGNKGVISKILPVQDMPFMPDGTIIDIILNPLGVPSRMNVGQIFECLLGLAGDHLNRRFKILPFDEMYKEEASRILIYKKLKEAADQTHKPWLFNKSYPGKMLLTNGKTGEMFDNSILVGKPYILKLIHLVDKKMHARSTGPYSLVTQQPLGGKSQNGGQRFGEMEVWALEAFGVAYTLQELLTLKSDDIDGRNEVFNAIVNGHSIPKPGIPESFRVLLSELQALGLDITTHKLERTKTGEIVLSKVNLLNIHQSDF
ncbi:unnamed protein product [Discosporangium mesarthrocarpum]